MLREFLSEPVEYLETTQVTEGVECDVYRFLHDPHKDLGVVSIRPGAQTPKQKILRGDRTVEGYLSGAGSLWVKNLDDAETIYPVDAGTSNFCLDLVPGQQMQWRAAPDCKLTVYEICYPPFAEGRFENLD